MYWLLRGAVALALLVVILLGIGFLLPDTRITKTTTMIDAIPSRVFQVMTEVEDQREWRNDVGSIEVESRGELWTWSVTTTDGVTFRYREKVKRPNELYEVDFESIEAGDGNIVATFEPVGEQRTKLTYTRSTFLPNPFARVLAYLLLNQEQQVNDYLSDLNRRVSMR